MSGRVFGDPFAVIPEAVLYADISSHAVRLYAIFQRHANKDGCAYPSLKRLAELVGASEDTIRRAKKELVDASIITVEPAHREDGSRTTDHVFLHGGGRAGATPPGRAGATTRRKAIMNEDRYISTRTYNAGKAASKLPDGDPRNLRREPVSVNAVEELPERHVEAATPEFAAATIARLRQRNVDG